MSDSEVVSAALLLQVSLLLSYSIWAKFLFRRFYILKFSRLFLLLLLSFSSSSSYYHHYHHHHYYHRRFITSISENVWNYKPALKKRYIKCYQAMVTPNLGIDVRITTK
jgi:hypothetical protein